MTTQTPCLMRLRPARAEPPLLRPSPRRQLTFAPLAWLKLQLLCHAGPTEVAAFGLAAEDDPLYLEDVLVVRQRCTAVTVAFDDEAVADLFDTMVDAGIPPGRFARVWLHTHPGSSVEPSGVDEETFHRVFGGCDWAVMAILGRTGNTYARLTFNAGPGGSLTLPVRVDWEAWPDEAARLADLLPDWERDYVEKVDESPRGSVPEFASSPGGRGDVGSVGSGVVIAPIERNPEFRRIADMTDAEFARFDAGGSNLSNWRDPGVDDFDQDTGEGMGFDPFGLWDFGSTD